MTVQEARQKARQRVSNEYNGYLNTLSTFSYGEGDIILPSSVERVYNCSLLYQYCVDNLIASTSFIGATGVWVELTIEQLNTLVINMRDRGVKAHLHKIDIYKNIDTLQTIEELESIVWTDPVGE